VAFTRLPCNEVFRVEARSPFNKDADDLGVRQTFEAASLAAVATIASPPARTGRREVQLAAGVLCQPLLDDTVFVGAAVVQGEVNVDARVTLVDHLNRPGFHGGSVY
jgi:hypothetical protein